MGGFYCPKCKMVRHIDDGDTPEEDRCWFCGTPVPYTEAELKRMRDDGDEDER